MSKGDKWAADTRGTRAIGTYFKPIPIVVDLVKEDGQSSDIIGHSSSNGSELPTILRLSDQQYGGPTPPYSEYETEMKRKLFNTWISNQQVGAGRRTSASDDVSDMSVMSGVSSLQPSAASTPIKRRAAVSSATSASSSKKPKQQQKEDVSALPMVKKGPECQFTLASLLCFSPSPQMVNKEPGHSSRLASHSSTHLAGT
jgi:hypothetical protein